MSETIKELRSVEELDQVLAESARRPVLIFKHSNACPISARARRELQEWLDQADPRAGYAMVTVQTARPVSNAIAEQLGIRHETPQAILVRDGRPVWDDSHFAITAAKLEEVINVQ